jgi:hypothetical protein
MIILQRRFRRGLPLALADVRLPVAGDRLEPTGRLLPTLVKIWCGERKTPGLIGKWVEDHTLITNLATFPTLHALFRSNLRRCIRRAIDEEGLVRLEGLSVDQLIAFHRDDDPTNPNIPDRGELSELQAAGRLSISAAMIRGKILAVHANIEDFPRVRVLKIYTRRKQSINSAEYNLIGRANKALHYLDMATFYERGFMSYDWGGFSGVANNGIDRFKLQFLGQISRQLHFRGVLPPGARDVAF